MTGSSDHSGRCSVSGDVCIVSTPHETGTHHGVSDLVTKGTDNDIRCPPSPSSSSTHSSSSYHTSASSASSKTGALVVSGSGCCSDSADSSSEFEVSVTEEITRAEEVSSDACSKEQVCESNNTVTPPHTGATEGKVIQPLLIQLPNTTPVGIDIDMVLPIVSYIHPYSPLRHHIEVGDIIIYVNGKSVMDLTHMELYQQLNGGKKTKTNSSIDDVNTQRERELTKLVFLPAKYRQQKKGNQQRIEQLSDEQQHTQCHPYGKMDVAANKDLDVETVNEDTDKRNDGEKLVEETNDNISATCSTEEQPIEPSMSSSSSSISNEEDSKSITRAENPSLDNQVTTDPIPLSRPCTPPPPPSRVVTKDDKKNMYYPASTFNHSTCDYSPFSTATKKALTTANNSSIVEGFIGSSADDNESCNISDGNSYADGVLATIVTNASRQNEQENDEDDELTSRGGVPLIDYLERKVKEWNENNQDSSDGSAQVVNVLIDEVANDFDSSSEKNEHEVVMITHESAEQADGEEKRSCRSVKSSDNARDAQFTKYHQSQHCCESKPEESEHMQSAIKDKENVIEDDKCMAAQEQQRSESVDEDDQQQDERDLRRLERKNRSQPQIEFVSISNNFDEEEDVSTLFGGVWSKQLHFSARRVEDNMVQTMEEGMPNNNTMDPNSFSQHQIRRCVNSRSYHAKSDSDVKNSSSRSSKEHNQQILIERILLVASVSVVIGLVVFLAAVLRR